MSRKQARPHIDKDRFKQIFRDHWLQFKNTHPRYNTAYYDQVINKMLDCGDPQKMGYLGFRCMKCGLFHAIAMTCKSTFCLSCAKPYTENWIDFIGRRLIPSVVYRHTILTVPKSAHRERPIQADIPRSLAAIQEYSSSL